MGLTHAFLGPRLTASIPSAALQRNLDVVTHGISNAPQSKKHSDRSATISAAAAGVGWAATSVLCGSLGAPFVMKASPTWYRKINLPSFTPPDRIFGPVWTTVYAMIGYSGYTIFKARGPSSLAMVLAYAHYVLNITWAPVFFGLKRLRAGHVINVLLLLSLSVIIPLFYAISPLAAGLLLPYWAWLAFATKLSSAVCALNPTGREGGYNNAMLQSRLYQLQQEAGARVGL